MRIALGIEYDGTEFAGWQRQAHATTVQAAVEGALSRIADAPLEAVCAGRTDAGVHATHQVVHVDTPVQRPERAWLRGVNSNMPPAVGVRWMREVPDDFHARFSATARSYRYLLETARLRPVLRRAQVAWTWRSLDVAAMQSAANHLVGEHDFTSFRAVACQARHPVRTIHRLTVSKRSWGVCIDVEANAFLHHMVRNIVGSLMVVGSGERDPAWLVELLQCRDRTAAGVTAPAGGLYLVGVRYPCDYGLPGQGWLPDFA